VQRGPPALGAQKFASEPLTFSQFSNCRGTYAVREPLEGTATPKATKWLEVIADPIRLGILRSLSQVAEATTSDLATWGAASSQTLRRHLEVLVALGVIDEHPARSDGETPGRPAARFSLPAEVQESVRSVFGAPAVRTAPAAVQAISGSRPAHASATFASTSSIAASGPTNGASAR
jgi:DNA-binding transcriptional ArsR family regulator